MCKGRPRHITSLIRLYVFRGALWAKQGQHDRLKTSHRRKAKKNEFENHNCPWRRETALLLTPQ